MESCEIDGVAVSLSCPRGAPGPGRPGVLFLHGVGGSWRQWEPVMSCLSPELAPVALDLPGHGASGGVMPAGVPACARFVLAVLDRLGLHAPLPCVGHSLGGVLALELGLSAAARFAGIGAIA